MTVKEKV